MIATGVIAPFLVPLKVAGVVAFVVALPYVLYQAWAFVAPGLYAHEKKLVLPLVIASTVLFLLGIAFCYFFVFGVVFEFVYTIAPKSISVAPDIENYMSFALSMFIAFGVTFEVPVVVIVLVRSGVVTGLFIPCPYSSKLRVSARELRPHPDHSRPSPPTSQRCFRNSPA